MRDGADVVFLADGCEEGAPCALDFGAVAVGQTAQASITLKDIGLVSGDVGAANITGSPNFAIESELLQAALLNGGEGLPFDITYTPNVAGVVDTTTAFAPWTDSSDESRHVTTLAI
ncbi:MAG TPA: hypothetical protein VGO62_22055, partial [Myxococcota bacterium]